MESNNSKVVLKNTLMLYFRQIIIMLVSLYTVRVVLALLGEVDYGIYNAVAGLVTAFSFLSGAMATASQRYFSYYIGKNDLTELKKVFSMMLLIYIFLAVLVAIIAESIGIWFLTNKMVIPDERVIASIYIYHFSVISFILTLITAPYMASIISHEDMGIYAWFSIIEAGLKLILVLTLPVVSSDKLVTYVLYLMIINIIVTTLYRGYCKKKYAECNADMTIDLPLIKELFAYSGWNLFGAGVGVAKNQMVNVLINIYFGPIVNAARGIATQVNAAVSSFSQNFSTALNPQIVKLNAQKKIDEMYESTFCGMRITYVLMFGLSIPLIPEFDDIFKLWLTTVPQGTVLFTQLTIVDTIIGSLSYPLGTAIQASGKIKWYQIICGTTLLLNFPVSWLFLSKGYDAVVVFFVAIVITVVATIIRLGFLAHIYHLKLNRPVFISNIVRITTFSLTTVIILLIIYWLDISIHFILQVLINYAVTCASTFFVGMKKSERIACINRIRRKIGQ